MVYNLQFPNVVAGSSNLIHVDIISWKSLKQTNQNKMIKERQKMLMMMIRTTEVGEIEMLRV